jgi:hypothetical protein
MLVQAQPMQTKILEFDDEGKIILEPEVLEKQDHGAIK